jgi:hypothetical protein
MSGDVAARKLVAEDNLEIRRHAQLEQVQIGFGEVAPRLLVEHHARFEGGAGEPVLDAPDGVPQVQQA